MTSAKEIFVGLLFFGTLIALGLLTILLSDFSLFRETYDYDIYFDQANELKMKDDVLIMGTLQGKVLNIEFFEEPLWDNINFVELWVRARVRMNIPLVLKEDYSIRIRNASLLGGKVMDIRLGKSNTLLDMDKSRLVGLAVRDPVEAISEFIETNKASVKSTMDKLNNLIGNVSDWSDKISRGEGTLGWLIQSDAAADHVDSILGQINQFTKDINRDDGLLAALTKDPFTRAKFDKLTDDITTVSDRMVKGEGTIGKLFQDPALYDKLLEAADGLEGISSQLRDGQGFAGKLLSVESEQAFMDFSKTLANVREISDDVAHGEGLVNALIKDPMMKDNLKRSLDRLDRITDQVGDLVADVKQGKGALGKILTDEEFGQKLDKLLDAVIGSVEDAREAAPLISLGSFLFGAI